MSLQWSGGQVWVDTLLLGGLRAFFSLDLEFPLVCAPRSKSGDFFWLLGLLKSLSEAVFSRTSSAGAS